MSRTEINLPYPETSDRHLKISVGACHLIIRPGESAAWVSGSYIDPVGILPLKIENEGGETRLMQALNPIEISGGFEGLTTLELELGKARLYWLTIESGASEADIDLGGLPLSRLSIRHAAGRHTVNFSTPNQQALVLFSLTVGAGVAEVQNLANANLLEMVIEGGAATYRLAWGSELKRPANVRIATGISLVEISIPESVAAQLTTDSFLGNLELGEGVIQKEGTYWTQSALDGGEPRLSIRASQTVGTLRLNFAQPAPTPAELPVQETQVETASAVDPVEI